MAASTSTAELIAAIPRHLRQHVHSGRELARRLDERAATERRLGIPPVDRLLGGGVRPGQLIELVGRPSSGRFSLALGVLATATGRGEAGALIDLGDTLDPQNAAAIGIDLERLLWIRPRHLKPALVAAESLVGTGFPVVVLDLGPPPVPGGRGAEAAWRRLARTLDERPTILLVTSPYRVSGGAARTVLRLDGGRPRWSGRALSPALLERLTARLELERACSTTRHGRAALDLAASTSPFAAPPANS